MFVCGHAFSSYGKCWSPAGTNSGVVSTQVVKPLSACQHRRLHSMPNVSWLAARAVSHQLVHRVDSSSWRPSHIIGVGDNQQQQPQHQSPLLAGRHLAASVKLGPDRANGPSSSSSRNRKWQWSPTGSASSASSSTHHSKRQGSGRGDRLDNQGCTEQCESSHVNSKETSSGLRSPGQQQQQQQQQVRGKGGSSSWRPARHFPDFQSRSLMGGIKAVASPGQLSHLVARFHVSMDVTHVAAMLLQLARLPPSTTRLTAVQLRPEASALLHRLLQLLLVRVVAGAGETQDLANALWAVATIDPGLVSSGDTRPLPQQQLGNDTELVPKQQAESHPGDSRSSRSSSKGKRSSNSSREGRHVSSTAQVVQQLLAALVECHAAAGQGKPVDAAQVLWALGRFSRSRSALATPSPAAGDGASTAGDVLGAAAVASQLQEGGGEAEWVVLEMAGGQSPPAAQPPAAAAAAPVGGAVLLLTQQQWGDLEHWCVSFMPQYKPEELANVLWGFAHAGQSCPVLLAAAAGTHGVCRPSIYAAWRPQQISTIAWAAARLGCRDGVMWDQLCRHAARRAFYLPPEALSKFLWACAVAEVVHVRCLDALLLSAVHQLPRFTVQGLSNMVWAVRQLGLLQAGWGFLVPEVERELVYKLEDASPLALATVLQAAAEVWIQQGHGASDTLPTSSSSSSHSSSSSSRRRRSSNTSDGSSSSSEGVPQPEQQQQQQQQQEGGEGQSAEEGGAEQLAALQWQVLTAAGGAKGTQLPLALSSRLKQQPSNSSSSSSSSNSSSRQGNGASKGASPQRPQQPQSQPPPSAKQRKAAELLQQRRGQWHKKALPDALSKRALFARFVGQRLPQVQTATLLTMLSSLAVLPGGYAPALWSAAAARLLPAVVHSRPGAVNSSAGGTGRTPPPAAAGHAATRQQPGQQGQQRGHMSTAQGVELLLAYGRHQHPFPALWQAVVPALVEQQVLQQASTAGKPVHQQEHKQQHQQQQQATAESVSHHQLLQVLACATLARPWTSMAEVLPQLLQLAEVAWGRQMAGQVAATQQAGAVSAVVQLVWAGTRLCSAALVSGQGLVMSPVGGVLCTAQGGLPVTPTTTTASATTSSFSSSSSSSDSDGSRPPSAAAASWMGSLSGKSSPAVTGEGVGAFAVATRLLPGLLRMVEQLQVGVLRCWSQTGRLLLPPDDLALLVEALTLRQQLQASAAGVTAGRDGDDDHHHLQLQQQLALQRQQLMSLWDICFQCLGVYSSSALVRLLLSAYTEPQMVQQDLVGQLEHEVLPVLGQLGPDVLQELLEHECSRGGAMSASMGAAVQRTRAASQDIELAGSVV